jgi:hypothetical protein
MSFIAIATAFLKAVSGELDEYTSEDAKIEQTGENEVTMFTPSHIQFARYGRGPGKNPPLDPILDWISKKGIIFDGTDAKGTAFAIQASIAKKGTKNWIPNAPNALDEVIDKHLREYQKDLNEEVVEEQSEAVNKVWEANIPRSINFKI